tara:strand:+ start:8757 stop:9041 length:285 start_codon:yes stop_codon:yes gene_type:complete
MALGSKIYWAGFNACIITTTYDFGMREYKHASKGCDHINCEFNHNITKNNPVSTSRVARATIEGICEGVAKGIVLGSAWPIAIPYLLYVKAKHS